MNAKERMNAWESDQLDPDNWLKIPDFGVKPIDVAFQGFGFPIVTPNSKSLRERHENIRALVKLIRSKIQKQFNSLADVRAAYVRVLEALYPQDGSPSKEEDKNSLTFEDKCATYYMIISQALAIATSDLKRAAQQYDVTPSPIETMANKTTGDFYANLPRSADDAALSLSRAALWIADWSASDMKLISHSLRIAEVTRQSDIQRQRNSDAGMRGAEVRHEQTRKLKNWALDQAKKMIGSDKDKARFLFKQLPKELAGASKDPERFIYDKIREKNKKSKK